MALNAKEWYLIALGILGSAVNGSIFPCFAIIFGEVLEVSIVIAHALSSCSATEYLFSIKVFSKSSDEILDAIHFPASLFVMLAVVAAIAIFTKVIVVIAG